MKHGSIFSARWLAHWILVACSAGLLSCAQPGSFTDLDLDSIPRSNNVQISHVSSNSSSWDSGVRRQLTGTVDKHGFPSYEHGAKRCRVRTTSYTHTESDHLSYGRKSAYGTTLRHGKVRSAAADWSRFPLGTTFKIRGLDYIFVIDDYGSALVGTNTIDIYTPQTEIMNRWGVRTVDIEIIRWGDFERSAEVLEARTKHRHCRAMFRAIESR